MTLHLCNTFERIVMCIIIMPIVQCVSAINKMQNEENDFNFIVFILEENENEREI